MDEQTIYVQPKILSDGSHVYDLIIPAMTLQAVGGADIVDLEAKILAAIKDHTNNEVTSYWRVPAAA